MNQVEIFNIHHQYIKSTYIDHDQARILVLLEHPNDNMSMGMWPVGCHVSEMQYSKNENASTNVFHIFIYTITGLMYMKLSATVLRERERDRRKKKKERCFQTDSHLQILDNGELLNFHRK